MGNNNHTHVDNHAHKHHNHAHGHPIVKNMFWAFIINALFTIIEFIGGILFNSTAILADAVHDLGDSIALGTTILIEKRSYKKRNNQFTFGYRRLSVLSGLINGIILLSGSAFMTIRAIERIMAPEAVNSVGMFGMAILGILFNGVAVLSLKSKNKGLNARALYLHLLEDALGWVVVLIGAVAIYFFDLPIIDPILSLGLSIFIAYNATRLLIPVYHILMESTPKSLNLDELEAKINAVKGLVEIHDVHTWSLDGEYHILSAHVTVEKELTDEEIVGIKRTLISICKEFHIYHTTFEMERLGDECTSDCD